MRLTRYANRSSAVYVAALTSFAAAITAVPTPASAFDDPLDQINESIPGQILLNVRYRYEEVDQAGFSRDAKAHTVRTRFGYESEEWYDFKFLAEAEWVEHLGSDRFNDTVNGRTSFPVVADPDALELNRATVTYTGLPDTAVKVGRQRIIFDNARFFGNVGFRQNEQTFDGVVVSNTSIPFVELAYGYVLQVNRIFGDDSRFGDFNSDVHVIRAAITGFPFGRLQGYAYFAEVDDVKPLSAETFGARFSGQHEVGEGLPTILYVAEYAHQADYGNNPINFDHAYYMAEGGVRYAGITLKGGVEVLEGDGMSAFQTPLATLHAFQGWADKFLTTPVAGIEDYYASIGIALPFDSYPDILRNINLVGVYHDFQAERGGRDYGWEIDAKLSMTVFNRFNLEAKYAHYESDGFATDTDKIWLSIVFNL